MHDGCILTGGVGSGKTHTAIQYYLDNHADKDLYVITTAKKRDSLDWERTAASAAIGKTRDATRAGVLRVDSWNNIANYKSVKGAFFVFDEQRLVGAGAWSKAFVFIAKRNPWVLLSATPGDTWLDYIPVFVANGFYGNRTEFKREHVVYNTYAKFPKVDHYVGVGILIRHKNDITVEMPYLKHTIRKIHDVRVDYDEALMKKVKEDRWHVYENRPLRESSELYAVSRRVANSDASRLTTVQSLMREHPRLIVFYNFDYELEILRCLATPTVSSSTSPTRSTGSISAQLSAEPQSDTSIPSNVTFAEWNGHKHQPVPDSDRWVYLVQYTAGAEGWNCTSTDVMVYYSLNYSFKIFEQGMGRIDRLDSTFVELHYYILVSDSWIDQAVRTSLRSKANFNEARYVL